MLNYNFEQRRAKNRDAQKKYREKLKIVRKEIEEKYLEILKSKISMDLFYASYTNKHFQEEIERAFGTYFE